MMSDEKAEKKTDEPVDEIKLKKRNSKLSKKAISK